MRRYGRQQVWLVPPQDGSKYRAAMRRSQHASRGAERFLSLRRFATAAEVAAMCHHEGRELWVAHCPPELRASSACGCDSDGDGGGEGESKLQAAPGGGAGRKAERTMGPPGGPLVAGSVPEPLPRLALVLGTEGEGVSDAMLALAVRTVFLPMHGFVQSLNVAVACGMLLQRLFDMCPLARGNLPPEEQQELRARASWTIGSGRHGCGGEAPGAGRQESPNI